MWTGMWTKMCIRDRLHVLPQVLLQLFLEQRAAGHRLGHLGRKVKLHHHPQFEQLVDLPPVHPADPVSLPGDPLHQAFHHQTVEGLLDGRGTHAVALAQKRQVDLLTGGQDLLDDVPADAAVRQVQDVYKRQLLCRRASLPLTRPS